MQSCDILLVMRDGEKKVGLNLKEELIALIDAHAESVEKKTRTRVTRSDAMRILIERGLSDVSRRIRA